MPSLEDLLAEVDKWFAEEVQSVPLSHSTEIYNQVHAAWQSLRNRLSVAMTGQALKLPASPDGEAEAAPESSAEEAAGEALAEDAEIPAGASRASKSRQAG